jgi:membrane protein
MATATSTPARAEVRSAVGELIRSFQQQKLTTWASSLSWQVITAIVPFLLFVLGLIGFLNIEGVWADIAKNLKPNVSANAFKLLDSTAKQVLTQKQVFWVTAGFALAMWEMSGGIRAVMRGLNEIYEIEERRSWLQRMRTSILLAIVVSFLLIVAAAVVWLGPLVYGSVGQPAGALLFLARWLIATALLGLAVGMTVRYAPDADQPAEWVSAGTMIVVVSWSVASLLFGLYIRYVASYGSVYGNLATIVVLFAYIYVSSLVFFAGARLDAIIRERVEGNPRGR